MANAPFVESPQYTALALGYTNPEYLADEIMPVVPGTVAESFTWDFFPAANFLTVPGNKVGRTGGTPTVRFHAEQRSSFTEDFGYQSPVPRSDQDKAARQRAADFTSYDPKAVAVKGLNELLMLSRELRVANLLGTAANHGRTVTLSGTDVFDNAAAPIQDIIEDARNKMPLPPNLMVCNQLIASKMRINAHVVEGVRGTGAKKGLISAGDLAELFELDRVLISRSRYVPGNFNDPTATTNNTRRVFGNWIALLHVNPLASLTGSVSQSWGMTARSRDKTVFEFFDVNQGVRGADVMRVGEFCREVVAAPICGTLIQNVLGTAEADINMGSSSNTSASALVYPGI